MTKLFASLLVLGACNLETHENLGFSQVGETRWAIALGGTRDDRASSVAFDSLGDVVVAGTTHDGATSSFISKHVASDGTARWTTHLISVQAPSRVAITAMVVTAEDDIIVTGSYSGTSDFGGQTLTQDNPTMWDDMFVARYASDGNLRWVKRFAPNSNAYSTSIALGPDGSIYVSAVFWHSTIAVDGHTYAENTGDPDAMLLAFDANGGRRWGHVFQGASGPYAASVALAANGDVLVTGSFGAETTFGGASVSPNARSDTFLARYRSDGLYLASRAIGPKAPMISAGLALMVDPAGRIVVQQSETDDSRPGSLDSSVNTVQVFDDAGVLQWSRAIENRGAGSPQMRAAVATRDGTIVSAAWTDGPYNATALDTVAGTLEVVTLAPDGAVRIATLGQRMLAGPWFTAVASSAASPSGALAFAGSYSGIVDLGKGPLDARSGNIFVVVVDPSTTVSD